MWRMNIEWIKYVRFEVCVCEQSYISRHMYWMQNVGKCEWIIFLVFVFIAFSGWRRFSTSFWIMIWNISFISIGTIWNKPKMHTIIYMAVHRDGVECRQLTHRRNSFPLWNRKCTSRFARAMRQKTYRIRQLKTWARQCVPVATTSCQSIASNGSCILCACSCDPLSNSNTFDLKIKTKIAALDEDCSLPIFTRLVHD